MPAKTLPPIPAANGTAAPQDKADEAPAEAIAAEVAGKTPRTLTFGEGEGAVELEIPRKWKRFKFMRSLARGDISAALESVWLPIKSRDEDGNEVVSENPALAVLEELEIDETEFETALERLAEALSGTSAGN